MFTEAALEFHERLTDLWLAQRAFSERTFGPDAARGPVGALRHLAREANEAADQVLADGHAPGTRASAKALAEFADVFLLLLDATRRAGFQIGHVLDAAVAKQRCNETKAWPAPTDPHAPVEHRPAAFDAARLLACVGREALDRIGAEDAAQVVASANKDAHEGKDWLPYYKAALCAAWSGIATQTVALRELATTTSPDSEQFAERLRDARALLSLSLRLAGNGPDPTPDERATVDRSCAEFRRAFDEQFPAQLGAAA